MDAPLEYVGRDGHGCRAGERAEGAQQPFGAAPGRCQQEDEASVHGALGRGLGVERELGWSHVDAGYGREPRAVTTRGGGLGPRPVRRRGGWA